MRTVNTLANILGHRGARGEILENTQEGFLHTQNLISRGLAGIELDIQLTADNKLLVTHDDTLDRLSNTQGRIEQLSATRSVNLFHQNTGFTTLTLDKLSSYLLGYQTIELEIKTHERMSNQALIDSLADCFFSHENKGSSQNNKASLAQLPIVFTSFDKDILHRLQHHTTLSTVPRGLLVENQENTNTAITDALRLQCQQIGVFHEFIDTGLMQQAQRYDLDVTAWTVNDDDDIKRMIECGVTSIITDYPTHILSLTLTS